MRPTGTNILIAISILAASFVLCQPASAESYNDGFNAAETLEGRYFTISVENGVDMQGLAMKVAVSPSITAIIKESVASYDSDKVADQLDLLFLAVSEIMDIRMRSFKCKVKVCKDASSLSAIALKLFDKETTAGGFYVVSLDTIYVDANSITTNVLGHELSHAVQSHYFVVPPPMKIQEVLAGYVEFQLRKYTNTLPTSSRK